jgi:hypothetical protein
MGEARLSLMDVLGLYGLSSMAAVSKQVCESWWMAGPLLSGKAIEQPIATGAAQIGLAATSSGPREGCDDPEISRVNSTWIIDDCSLLGSSTCQARSRAPSGLWNSRGNWLLDLQSIFRAAGPIIGNSSTTACTSLWRPANQIYGRLRWLDSFIARECR